ncbi:WXG100 family type VII secretion target [Paenibacillus silvae]|uniref:WXG100 family type VII secretion target n=1 Tax=Paenibacillus silvae TaxID=1325358 RepID=UPI002005E244|nr:WXG100 family type VII secretion target [Paenibacillus silvae]MCK6077947.1 WXG100 family type VII secretion target [Paenibacillus silvae]MCK6152146.1 WXG100 family type VII secretion target [Paenibacillus silvae]MCK6270831.1 WXG100 family type VII secretion target [Paenibacillus silvae]
MLRIQVHPDELEAKARLVQQCKLELDRIVRELDKSIYFLQSEWSGATREQFFWDFMEVKDVFPATLGKLDEIQKEFTFIANNFRTTDSTGEVALYIPNELKPSFFTGAVDKAIGDTVTGLGEMAEAFLYHPFSTIGNLAYDMTLGKVVDARRGIAFAWDAVWGTGTARSDIEQFVDEQKKQLNEDESGYYKGALVGQALSYFIFGRALRSKDHYGSGGGSGGKKESEQGSGKEGTGKFNDPVITKTNKGMEVEFVNPHGNKIKWVEQNPKNIQLAIESAKNSSNSGKAIEGKVADYVQQKTDAIGFGLKLDDVTNKKIAGDIDVLTNREIIEVKKSFSALDMKQIDKYTNPQNPLFFNYEGKEVIVYIDEALDMSNSNVISTIQELKAKDVTVVNSLDELGGVLK